MQNISEKVNEAHNEQIGRHLVVNMDIEPGETILEERPLLVAPHWDCDQMKCAQCALESYVMCKKCEVFPLCMTCTTHAAYECDFFSNNGAGANISKNLLVKNYPICAALKLLLLMEQGESVALDVHLIQLSNYRDTEMWQEHDEQVVAPLLQSGLAEVLNKTKLDAEFLHKLCIAIDTHAFEVTARDGDSLKGVYVFGAQLPHHCVPNTVIALDEDFNMKIYAAVPLHAGDIIYNSYANPLMGTSQRQHQLLMSRHINCGCSRCLDPTELGTHMSSMKCKQCPDGYAVCQLVDDNIDNSGTDDAGNWKCTSCNAVIPAIEVHKLLTSVGEALVNAEGDLDIYEELLARYAQDLHPNHFLLLDIKQNIASILRAAIVMNSLCDPGRKLLARRVQLCEELLPVTRAVVPGISKLYAIALFEYLLAFLELAELEFRSSVLSKELYHHKLKIGRNISAEALELMLFEPTNSPESHLTQRIIMEQKRIEEELKKFNDK